MSITMEELAKRMDELEKENARLRKGAVTKTVTAPSIEIGCNLLEGVQVAAPSGEVDVSIKGGEIITLSAEDVTQVLKGSVNRKFFIDGLLYFVDEDNYEKFSVKRKFNINRDVIQYLVCTNDIDKMRKFFNDVTKNRLEATMVHTIFYTIVLLEIDHEINDMRYETRQFIEEYFYMKIKDAIMLYLALKKVEG